MTSNATETETVVAVSKPGKKLKPARKQVKAGDVEKKETPQTGKEYSMFHCLPPHRRLTGFRLQISGTTNGLEVIARTVTQSMLISLSLFLVRITHKTKSKTKSQTRCNIKRDSGLTRANTTGIKYVCIFFARGCCPYGWECEYLHTLPDPSTALPDSSKDCFARDKFADYRDDMGGVGSFNRQNRTLYVGRIKETGNGLETEEVVMRHFKEWGVIERGESDFVTFLSRWPR